MKKISLFTAGLLLTSYVASASDIYSITVTNSTQAGSFTKGDSSLTNIVDYFDDSKLNSLLTSGYADTDAVSATLDMRGLPVTLAYTGGETTLTFKVPSLGITETFTGATRDESNEMLEEWFEKNGAATMEKIMKELARVSPVDPIAGNSNSIMAKTVESDFTNGFLNTATKQKVGKIQNTKNGNTLSIAPTFKSLEVDGKDSTSYTLPLAYSIVAKDDSAHKLTFSLPLSYTDVEGAKSYSLGLGVGYSLPVNNAWTLTPSIGYSIAGSIDLGALAQVANASITSSYTFNIAEDQRLSIGNMVGYYTTVKFYSGDYAYDPGIKNTVFRNGLMYSIDTDNVLKNTSLDLYAVNTKYTGTDIYNDSYNEFGFSFGYNNINVNMLSDKEKYAYKQDIKIGASYLTSDKEKGFKINFGFTF